MNLCSNRSKVPTSPVSPKISPKNVSLQNTNARKSRRGRTPAANTPQKKNPVAQLGETLEKIAEFNLLYINTMVDLTAVVSLQGNGPMGGSDGPQLVAHLIQTASYLGEVSRAATASLACISKWQLIANQPMRTEESKMDNTEKAEGQPGLLNGSNPPQPHTNGNHPSLLPAVDDGQVILPNDIPIFSPPYIAEMSPMIPLFHPYATPAFDMLSKEGVEIDWGDQYFLYEQKKKEAQIAMLKKAEEKLDLARLEFDNRVDDDERLLYPENALMLTVDVYLIENPGREAWISELKSSNPATKELVPLRHSLMSEEMLMALLGKTREELYGEDEDFLCELIAEEQRARNNGMPVIEYPTLEDEGFYRAAERIVQGLIARFDVSDDVFEAVEQKVTNQVIADFHKVAEGFIMMHQHGAEVISVYSNLTSFSGDVRGCFASLHMSFMRTTPSGDFHQPAAAMVCLGGYSGETPHGVEVISLIFALRILYPEFVVVLRSSHDEEAATRDLKNPFSLRSRCYALCGKKKGERLWKSLQKAIMFAPIAAIINDNVIASHVDLTIPQKGLVLKTSDSREVRKVKKYLQCHKRKVSTSYTLKKTSVSLIVRAGKVHPEDPQVFDAELKNERIVNISGALSTYKECDNKPSNRIQGCGVTRARILLYRWFQNHRPIGAGEEHWDGRYLIPGMDIDHLSSCSTVKSDELIDVPLG